MYKEGPMCEASLDLFECSLLHFTPNPFSSISCEGVQNGSGLSKETDPTAVEISQAKETAKLRFALRRRSRWCRPVRDSLELLRINGDAFTDHYAFKELDGLECKFTLGALNEQLVLSEQVEHNA